MKIWSCVLNLVSCSQRSNSILFNCIIFSLLYILESRQAFMDLFEVSKDLVETELRSKDGEEETDKVSGYYYYLVIVNILLSFYFRKIPLVKKFIWKRTKAFLMIRLRWTKKSRNNFYFILIKFNYYALWVDLKKMYILYFVFQ